MNALGFGLVLGIAGLFARARRSSYANAILVVALIVIVGATLARIVLVHNNDRVRLVRLEHSERGPLYEGDAPLLSRLLSEPDGALISARVLTWLGTLRDPAAPQFPEILRQAYQRTDPNAGDTPTPAIATYLGLQSPEAFDLLVIAPPTGFAPSSSSGSTSHTSAPGAVIFLHGYAGNFYVYCWEMSRAAAVANLYTLCPSMNARAAWWTSAGGETVEATLSYAQRLGIQRFYLAGLSNGAAGASVLATQFAPRLSGLILISGTRAQNPPTLPVLVVQGAQDAMMPASYARAYAERSRSVVYRELTGGHFVFLSEYQRARSMISEFLISTEDRPAAP